MNTTFNNGQQAYYVDGKRTTKEKYNSLERQSKNSNCFLTQRGKSGNFQHYKTINI